MIFMVPASQKSGRLSHLLEQVINQLLDDGGQVWAQLLQMIHLASERPRFSRDASGHLEGNRVQLHKP